MKPALLFLLAAQQGPVTVGDTVRVERVVGEVGTAVVRPQVWNLGQLGDQLGPAEVIQGARGVVVRYALALWYPGEHTLTMPGPVVVRRDGSSDTLAASTHRVSLTSVLPRDEPRSRLAPKPAREPVPIASRSPLPLVVAAGLVLLGGLAAALRWRRRGPPLRRPRPAEVFPPVDLLQRWTALGEFRAALDGWSWRLARRLAQSRDLQESAALQRVLDEIADQVYLPERRAALAALCERAARLDAA